MMGRDGGGRNRPSGDFGSRYEHKERRSGWGVAPPSRRLWVGNLSPNVTQSALSEHFVRFGEVGDISFVPGRSYAFVNYRKVEDAVIAMRGLQGSTIAGMPLRIEYAKGDRASGYFDDEECPPYNDERHFVERGRDIRIQHSSTEKSYEKTKGMKAAEPSEVLWIGFPASLRVDEIALRRAFSPFGEIVKITTFPGRSYAFVQYRSVVAACRAKEALKGKLFNNSRVNICFAKSDIAAAELGKSLDRGSYSHSNPSYEPGLSRQDFEAYQREREFESPPREFAMVSPQLASNFDWSFGDNRIMGFDRSSSVHPGAGSGLNIGIDFGDNRMQDLGSERRVSEDLYERHKHTPPVETVAPWDDVPFERSQRNPPFDDSRDVENNSYPSIKKLKTSQIPDELPEYPFREFGQGNRGPGMAKFFPGLPEVNPYIRSSFPPLTGDKNFPDLPKKPVQTFAEVNEPWRQFDNVSAGPAALPASSVKLQKLDSVPQQPLLKEEWKWEGTIAKGGTPICRARCFPVGKVLDFMLPEFLNCTARTGLDMLAKHYYQAASTWVVFFVPETDADIVFYNEFMHYLREKQRAAVAKLGEKITLFLVPPSEFSEQVLRVPGKVSISGVILRFHQSSSNFDSLHHPLETHPKPTLLAHQLKAEASSTEGASVRQLNSPDFTTLPPGQNSFSSSLEQFPPRISAFPPLDKSDGYSSKPGFIDPPERPDLSTSWLNPNYIPSSSAGNFRSIAQSSTNLSEHPSESFLLTNMRAAQGTHSSINLPEISSNISLPASKPPALQEFGNQPTSSMTLPLQSEQLAQLAALLAQQKQPGRESVLPIDRENKQLNLLHNPSSHGHTSLLHGEVSNQHSLTSVPQVADPNPRVSTSMLPVHAPAPPPGHHASMHLLRASEPPGHVSLPSGPLGPQTSQTQHFQQHMPNIPSAQQAINPGQESSQQAPNSKQEEPDSDPQKRLQATLQLAAALLQQIQQQGKTGDQQ